jgi:sorbitol-specific phosphotransferase system component IIC
MPVVCIIYIEMSCQWTVGLHRCQQVIEQYVVTFVMAVFFCYNVSIWTYNRILPEKFRTIKKNTKSYL